MSDKDMRHAKQWRNARMRYVKPASIALLRNAQRSHRGGLGAKKSPMWSAERRASPGCADCVSWSARGRKARRKRLRACVTGPRKGAAAPERLSALRSLVFARGNETKLGEQMPRENDDACAVHTAVIPGRAKGASPESISLAAAYGFRARRFAAPRNDRGMMPHRARLPPPRKPPTLARPDVASARPGSP
jgi:hypothetical protein